ncbi:YchJ family protein [Galbitalea soli]|uniref:YchJ-like middle NTF2-like domain-containing protein n=1 Tax=Galbitalea soli TaxID=1268042 RepID=A0A7C9TPD0_9MICO|nr:YchJ family metal-binding protein [Galbitalea soli]NEM90040.1 hypothetical protein [Galbitalea soli]NYJ30747.1 SEC-C motif-containing protein [Galbitalea soli]
MTTLRCPCQSGLPYDECCGPIHSGAAAPTAEKLMRSRFSAFALGRSAYLLASWHPSTRPAALDLDPEVRWFRLDILGRTGGGLLDQVGTVEFDAHYRHNGATGIQHENSRFTRVDGRWAFLE